MIQVVAPAVPAYGAPPPLNLPPSPTGTVFDLRGQTFYLHYSANLDPEGPCQPVVPSPLPTGWTTGLRPTNKYPLVNPGDVTATNGTQDAELFGGRIQGDISLTLRGDISGSNGGYCNSAAVDLRTWTSTRHVVRQMRINRVWDAIRFNKYPGAPTNHGVYDCWIDGVRDDGIENDLGLGGIHVADTLFEGFNFLSYKLESSVDHSAETILLERNLIGLCGFPYGHKQPDNSRIVRPYHLAFLKCGVSASARAKLPKIAMHDCVIAAEVYNPNGAAPTAGEATGSDWANSFRQIDPARCGGNTFLWMAGDTVPPIMLDQMPAGWGTVLTGQAAQNFWHYSVARWMLDHATNFGGCQKPVERLEGDLPWVVS